MNKQEFLEALRKGLPEADREERISFYSEMIDDRMEEGLSEEEAVSAVGRIDEILASDTPKPEEPAKKNWKTWEILLLVLGTPVWLSLLIAAAAVVLSVYVSVWALIVSLWAVFGALFVCALGSAAAGIGLLFGSHIPTGIAALGVAMVCAGVSNLLLEGCKAATKGTVRLTGFVLKKCFKGKENR